MLKMKDIWIMKMNTTFSKMTTKLKGASTELQEMVTFNGELDPPDKFDVVLKLHEINKIASILESMLYTDGKEDDSLQQLLKG